MEVSQFRFVSIGLVAENKALGSKDIKVTLIEQQNLLDGEIKSEPQALEASGTDAKGVNYSGKVIADAVVRATWHAMASTNRQTAPDVRRGERVRVYQQGDSPRYFWVSCGDDDHLRKLETVRYTFSGTSDEGKDSTGAGNCYYFEISTHRKLSTFQTAQQNGEPYLHTIQVNSAEGVVVITDDVGNYVEIDSSATKITLRNADGTYLMLDRQHIKGYAPQTIHLEAGTKFTQKCGATEVVFTPGGTRHATPKFEGVKS